MEKINLNIILKHGKKVLAFKRINFECFYLPLVIFTSCLYKMGVGYFSQGLSRVGWGETLSKRKITFFMIFPRCFSKKLLGFMTKHVPSDILIKLLKN